MTGLERNSDIVQVDVFVDCSNYLYLNIVLQLRMLH